MGKRARREKNKRKQEEIEHSKFLAREKVRVMNNDGDFMNLKVFYKMPKCATVKEDWVITSLKEMMDILEKDGVTKESVEFLYIHYTPVGGKNGETLELVAVDNAASTSKMTHIARAAKPHIRLVAADIEKKDPPKQDDGVIHSYLYFAARAA